MKAGAGSFAVSAQRPFGEGLMHSQCKDNAHTSIRDAPYAGIYVYFYEHYKTGLGTSLGLTGVPLSLSAGSLGGLSATLLTQPFDLVKTRMQLHPGVYKTSIGTLLVILRVFMSLVCFVQELTPFPQTEGLAGLFSGSIPRLLRKPLQSMVAWTVYEQLLPQLQKSLS